jgi:glycylpeptide N-tetradecanoyltransferase
MASSSGKARAIDVEEDHEQSGSGSEASEEQNLGDHSLPEASTPSTSSKKGKKKKKKGLKVLNALRKDHVPQELVNVVLDKVKGTGQVPEANEETVRAALEHMKIRDVIEGKSGVGGINKKDMGGHKVSYYEHDINLNYAFINRVC